MTYPLRRTRAQVVLVVVLWCCKYFIYMLSIYLDNILDIDIPILNKRGDWLTKLNMNLAQTWILNQVQYAKLTLKLVQSCTMAAGAQGCPVRNFDFYKNCPSFYCNPQHQAKFHLPLPSSPPSSSFSPLPCSPHCLGLTAMQLNIFIIGDPIWSSNVQLMD